jgi:hypothetical protein
MTKLDILFDPSLERRLVAFIAERVEQTAAQAAALQATRSVGGTTSTEQVVSRVPSQARRESAGQRRADTSRR